MTVAEMIDQIIGAYAGANADAMRTYKPVFYARFQRREGDALQRAFEATLADFKPTARQSFPIPADFERHMPSIASLPAGRGKPLDFEARRRRSAQLMTAWWQAQGNRVSRGIPEVRIALEFIAKPLADLRGFSDNPEPLELTREQVQLAWHRAISTKRRDIHGMMPKAVDDLWAQLCAIAEKWGVRLKREEWEATTKKPERRDAA